jgi:CubicO group peptidase (beta-lactamase class C family)
VLTQRGFGYADVAKRIPVDPVRTLFRPGSVAKLFTWTAVMQQVEEGRINLDADINTYIDFKIPARAGKPITMRQLMTHSAGFEDHAKDIMFYDPANIRPLDGYLKSWVPKRIYDAGTTPAYSNYSTALAGYAVQRVSGIPLETYIEKRIFAPLGMTSSTFRQPLPAALAPRMALGYNRASAPPARFELVGPWPAGSLSSNGADMGNFMIAHLQNGAFEGNSILRPETARMMHDTPLTIVPPLNRMELGFFETNINGRQVIGHLGDSQTFHTALHLFLADNVGLYVSMNGTGKDGAAGQIRTALFEDFADRYFPSGAGDGRVDPKLSAEHARMMAGQWQSSRHIETGFMRVLTLLGQVEVGVDAQGDLVIPSLTGPNGVVRKWVEIAPFVWRDRDSHERLAAKLVDGKVVRWSVDGASPFVMFDRVPGSLSSGWIMPLLYASLLILLLTFLQWPAAALVRRHYKSPLAAEGRSRIAYRGVRLASGLVLAVLVGWMMAFTTMMGDITYLTAAADPMLWTLQIVGLIVFVGAVVIAGWNAWLAFGAKARWTGKLAAIAILLASLIVLYVAFTFGLIDLTVNY